MSLREQLGLNKYKPGKVTEKKPAAKAALPHPGPKAIGTEDVVCLCGHVEKMNLFELKHDRFQDARREKMQQRPCSTCRRDEHDSRTFRDWQKAGEKRRKNPPQARHRLPDGSTFFVTYNAESESWTGTLTVTGENGHTLTAMSRGVFGLLSILDSKYRQWLHTKQQEKTEVTEPQVVAT